MSDMKRCEKRERDRSRKWRNTKQGKFEASFLHVNFEENETRENSPSWLSDGGKGADDIIAAVDGEPTREELAAAARRRLEEFHPQLVEVFDLIMKNGKNRKESICELAKQMQMRKQK